MDNFSDFLQRSSFLENMPENVVGATDPEMFPNSEMVSVPTPDDPILDEVPGAAVVSYETVRSTTARFSGASWFEKVQEQTIIVGGQGGISSWLTLLLSRMRPTAIYTFDMDSVEEVNLAGQLYAMEHIGKFKCDSVIDTVKRYSNYGNIFGINEAYTENSMADKIMMCGFDNMVARRVFYNNWKRFVESLPEEERKQCLFVDGRLNAETLQILCITGDAFWDMATYEEQYLFADSEALSNVCSFKQTAFTANIIAGLMSNLFINFCANLTEGGCRSIPFYTSYEADMMYLKQEGGV